MDDGCFGEGDYGCDPFGCCLFDTYETFCSELGGVRWVVWMGEMGNVRCLLLG